MTLAVIAGSKPFLAILLAPLTERVGVRPRVAGDPKQALALCREPVRLLVFEYQGEQWLPLCRELQQAAGGPLAMVAAVPPEHVGARPALAEAGVLQSPLWSGNPAHLLEAVDGVLVSLSSEAVSLEDLVPALATEVAAPSAAAAEAQGQPPVEPLPVEPPEAATIATPQELVPSETWPGTVLPSYDAEFLLVSAVGGSSPRAPSLREVTRRSSPA